MKFQITLKTAAITLILPWLVTALALVALLGFDAHGTVAFVAAGAATAGAWAGCALSLAFALQSARFLTRARDALRDLPSGGAATLASSLIREQGDFASAFNAMAAQWRASRQALSHQAFHDPLTGLANRAAFMTAASEALSRSRGAEQAAVLFIDLDRFKAVNDTLGHGVGDSLLSVVAARLASSAGPDGVVARLGGDEFTVLYSGTDAEARALTAADTILQRLRKPVSIGGRELFANASIGIATGGPPILATELLRRADIALYQAKEAGKGRFVLFSEADHQLLHDPVQLEAALRHAIERDELQLLYQPEVDLRTGAIVGMEALLRWRHPHLGVLAPAEFLAMAEESGEIATLGQWALERACLDVKRLQDVDRRTQQLAVAVNLSASEFVDPALGARIRGTIRKTGVHAESIVIELTESILVRNVQETASTLAGLRAIGVQVAIDDFGTGYSSLSYLQAFAADSLKLDQSFVRRIGKDERSGAIIEAVVELARALGLRVVAEGVETAAEADYLLKAGCHTAQGHFFSEPLSVDDFEALLLLQTAHPGRSAA
jgi:diguanylate cyclase (GGDEF)-like protein